MQKLISIKNKIKVLKKNKKIIGLCHGVFDVLHYGHLKHFEAAKQKCDYLFVSITSNQFIKKGLNRPINNNYQRLSFLQNLKLIATETMTHNDEGIFN